MSNRIEALLSDADGTLVDTVKLIRHGQHQAAIEYLTSFGLSMEDLPDYDEYERHLNMMVGGPARHTLEATLNSVYADRLHLLDGVDYDELHDLLNPTQDEIAKEFIEAYESLDQTLQHLGDAGIKLAILTSGTSHHVVRNFSVALPHLGTLSLLDGPELSPGQRLDIFSQKMQDHYRLPEFTVITADDTPQHKPDQALAEIALRRLDADSQRSAVLGDHKVDMQLGVNAGLPYRIGITHGFDDQKTLTEAGATHTIDSLDELSRLLS